MKYIPTPRINTLPDKQDKSLSHFERDFSLKVFFAGDTKESSSVNTKLRVKSTWIAPLPPKEIDTRIMRFCQAIRTSFIKRTRVSNLSTAQQSLLNAIKQNPKITIASADKNLGPVGLNTKQYIEWGLKHLQDKSTYKTVSEEQALSDVKTLCKEIFDWTQRHRKTLTNNVVHYICHHLDCTIKDPFGYFYLLVKLHKTPISTRPVCSDCASVPHALGK